MIFNDREDIDWVVSFLDDGARKEIGDEAREIVSLLREHIAGADGIPICRSPDFEEELLVLAAMASDCDACRATLMIEPLCRDKNGIALNLRPEPIYEPMPMLRADEMIEQARKKRDGY